MQRINGEIPEYESEIDQISDEQDNSIPADPNVRNFSYTLVNGQIYFRENDKMTPAVLSMTAENRVKGLLEIRDSVRSLIEYQTNDYPEEMISTEQENLNRLYDAFTAKYGLINNRGNYLAFAADESYFLLCSLEVLDDEGNFKRKADMFTKRTIKPHREITSVETASEALALSIGEKARVDLSYYDSFNTHYCLNLCGKAKHKVDLGSDALGNLTRIENEIGKIPARLEAAKTRKAETLEQLTNAKTEVLKPFAFEDELKEKNDRLNALNIELNLDEKDTSVMDTEPEQTEEQPERKTQDRER